MNFWNSPELARPSDYVSFKAAGDTVTGTITALRSQAFTDNGIAKTVPQLDLDTVDGPRTLTAGQTRLQIELMALQPQVGDLLTVTMTGIQKRPGGKTLKEFQVTVGHPPAAVEGAPVAAEPAELGLI